MLIDFFYTLRAAKLPVSVKEFLTLLEALQSRDEKVAVPPLVGALLKNEQDVTLFEKLVFMQRNNR